MRKTRLSEENLVKILRKAEQSTVAKVAKKHGITEQAIYAWRKRFQGKEPADIGGRSIGAGCVLPGSPWSCPPPHRP